MMSGLPDRKFSEDRILMLTKELNILSEQNKSIVDRINCLSLEKDIYLNIIALWDLSITKNS